MWLILSLAAALFGEYAFAQTYPSGNGTDAAPWYTFIDFDIELRFGINSANRIAYFNAGDNDQFDDVTFTYPYSPYGNGSTSLRAHNDLCSYAYFQNISSATTANAYRIVFTNSDPSGLGPVIFTLSCNAGGSAATGCFNGLAISDLRSGTNYGTYSQVDGDDSSAWVVLSEPIPDSASSTVSSQQILWETNTADALAQSTSTTSVCAITTSAPVGTPGPTAAVYTFTVTGSSSTYTTVLNPSQANVYTRSLASVSHESSVSARVSSLSANSASRASVQSTHSLAVVAASASKAAAQSSVAARQSTHSATLAELRSSRTSRQATHSASLQDLRSSRTSRQSTHSASLAAARTSRSSYDAVHASTLSDNAVSRSLVRASKSSVQSAATLSRSQRSTAVASSKYLASLSRDSLRSVATSSKSIASASRSSARVAASSSKSSASLARVSANLAASSARSVASASRVSANLVLSSEAAVRSASLASVSSVKSVSSASRASVVAASIASVQSQLAAQGGGQTTSNHTGSLTRSNSTAASTGSSRSATPSGAAASASSASLFQRAYYSSASSHCTNVPAYTLCPASSAVGRREAAVPTVAEAAMITPAPEVSNTTDYHEDDDADEFDEDEGKEDSEDNDDEEDEEDDEEEEDEGEESVGVDVVEVWETVWVTATET